MQSLRRRFGDIDGHREKPHHQVSYYVGLDRTMLGHTISRRAVPRRTLSRRAVPRRTLSRRAVPRRTLSRRAVQLRTMSRFVCQQVLSVCLFGSCVVAPLMSSPFCRAFSARSYRGARASIDGVDSADDRFAARRIAMQVSAVGTMVREAVDVDAQMIGRSLVEVLVAHQSSDPWLPWMHTGFVQAVGDRLWPPSTPLPADASGASLAINLLNSHVHVASERGRDAVGGVLVSLGSDFPRQPSAPAPASAGTEWPTRPPRRAVGLGPLRMSMWEFYGMSICATFFPLGTPRA